MCEKLTTEMYSRGYHRKSDYKLGIGYRNWRAWSACSGHDLHGDSLRSYHYQSWSAACKSSKPQLSFTWCTNDGLKPTDVPNCRFGCVSVGYRSHPDGDRTNAWFVRLHDPARPSNQLELVSFNVLSYSREQVTDFTGNSGAGSWRLCVLRLSEAGFALGSVFEHHPARVLGVY